MYLIQLHIIIIIILSDRSERHFLIFFTTNQLNYVFIIICIKNKKKKNSKNDSKIENIKIISIDGAIIVYTAENIIYVFIQPVVVTIYTHIYKLKGELRVPYLS